MDGFQVTAIESVVSEIGIFVCYTEIDVAGLEGLEGTKVDHIKSRVGRFVCPMVTVSSSWLLMDIPIGARSCPSCTRCSCSLSCWSCSVGNFSICTMECMTEMKKNGAPGTPETSTNEVDMEGLEGLTVDNTKPQVSSSLLFSGISLSSCRALSRTVVPHTSTKICYM